MWRYLSVGFKLGEAHLDARRDHALGSLEATLRHEALDLAWVGLILDAVLTPAYHSVEDATFFGVVRARAEPGFNSNVVFLRDRLLQLVQRWFRTAGGEVAPVHGGYDTFLGVPE